MLLDEGLDLFSHDLFYQGGQVLKVVVEGIAVDASVLHNVLEGDLVERMLVEQS